MAKSPPSTNDGLARLLAFLIEFIHMLHRPPVRNMPLPVLAKEAVQHAATGEEADMPFVQGCYWPAAHLLLFANETSWTGSSRFGYSVTFPAGGSKIEPGATPAGSVVLTWETFTEAVDEAGMSSRYSGIHFRHADLAGRQLRRLVASKVWARAQSYLDGTVKPLILQRKERTENRTASTLP
jgi:hypothetical protein